jgi:hypothetical protein
MKNFKEELEIDITDLIGKPIKKRMEKLEWM